MCEKKDQIRVLAPPDANGRTPALHRSVDGETKPCVIEEHKEGTPIYTKMVALRETDCPITYDVETLYDPGAGEPSSDGPAMVNSREFKDGWERVFGGKEDDLAN